jgi:hypothetical protein
VCLVGCAFVASLLACGGDPPRVNNAVASGRPEPSFVVPEAGSRLGLAQLRAPLPTLAPGWEWPFDPSLIAHGLPALTVFRPINVTALTAAASAPRSGRVGRSVLVAKNVWITPMREHLDIGRAARRLMVQSPGPRAPGAEPQGPIPDSVDLRTLGLDGPIRHQQSAPVCWSFAFANVMENALLRAGRTDSVSPLHLVYHDEWLALQKSSRGRPTTQETSWPYDPIKACKLVQTRFPDDSCENAYGVSQGSFKSDPELAAEAQRMDTRSGYSLPPFSPRRIVRAIRMKSREPSRPGEPFTHRSSSMPGRGVLPA